MTDAVRQSSRGKEMPGEEAATHTSLTVTGRVTQDSGGAIGGLLAEAIDVRARGQLVRLGTAAVNGGSFSMAIPLEAGLAKNPSLRLDGNVRNSDATRSRIREGGASGTVPDDGHAPRQIGQCCWTKST